MFLRLCLFVLVVLPSFIQAQTSDEDRIIGGQVSTAFIPYQIALYINGAFACGGSLITNNCVVTAAHCVNQIAVTGLKIRAGIRKLSTTGGGTRNVTNSYVPSTYNGNTGHYDVAILKFASTFNSTNIKPIALNNVPMKVGDQLKVSGWGLTKESGVSVSDQLRYVVVPAVDRNTCQKEYPGSITNTMFCAGPKAGGKDACAGDSGGPAVKDNKLYGIVSWGKGCARPNAAGVYTAVRQVLPWLNQAIAKHCN